MLNLSASGFITLFILGNRLGFDSAKVVFTLDADKQAEGEGEVWGPWGDVILGI